MKKKRPEHLCCLKIILQYRNVLPKRKKKTPTELTKLIRRSRANTRSRAKLKYLKEPETWVV